MGQAPVLTTSKVQLLQVQANNTSAAVTLTLTAAHTVGSYAPPPKLLRNMERLATSAARTPIVSSLADANQVWHHIWMLAMPFVEQKVSSVLSF